jgi:hypothetical protein
MAQLQCSVSTAEPSRPERFFLKRNRWRIAYKKPHHETGENLMFSNQWRKLVTKEEQRSLKIASNLLFN